MLIRPLIRPTAIKACQQAERAWRNSDVWAARFAGRAALVKDICPHFRGLMPLTPVLPGSEPSPHFQRVLITPLRRSGTTFAAHGQAKSGAAAPDISLGRALPRIGSIAALVL